MEEWRCSSIILELSARWSGMVSFTALPLYSLEKKPSLIHAGI
jgi:hypothetical protein